MQFLNGQNEAEQCGTTIDVLVLMFVTYSSVHVHVSNGTI